MAKQKQTKTAPAAPAPAKSEAATASNLDPIQVGILAYEALREEVGSNLYPAWDDLTPHERAGYETAKEETLITHKAPTRFAALVLEIAGFTPVEDGDEAESAD